MRFTALLAVLLGCSAGPSVVVSEPPAVVDVPVVVEPVETIDTTPELVDVSPVVVHEPVEAPVVPVNDSESPDSCQCGDNCNCADCQCAECPHSKENGQTLYDADREVKDSNPTLLRPHTIVFTAPWCAPCVPAKAALEAVFSGPHGDVYKRCLTFVDADTSPRRMAFYGVPALPCYVLIDEELNVLARHVGVMTADQYREFVDANTLPKGTGRVTHDAQRHDAAKPDSSAPSHVQVNAGRGTATGVCVGAGDGLSLVLTNHHVCFEGGRQTGVPSVYLDGRWIPGELIASDNDADLALFSVPAQLRPVAIADVQPAAGSQVRTYGYGGGRHTPRVTVTLAGYPGGGQMVGCCLTRFAFVPGESGSAVMHGDRLVGLVTGRDPSGRFGVVVDLASIRAFLARQGVL